MELLKRLVLVNIYPIDTMARYLLSSYSLKGYLRKYFSDDELAIDVKNFSQTTQTSEIVDWIEASNPDLVGCSCYIWNIEKIINTITSLRNRSNNITYILGGPEISLNRISSLSNSAIADYYVIGEGEQIFCNLINYLRRKENSSIHNKVPQGVAYWKRGKLNYVERRSSIVELDNIPSIYLNNIIDDRLYARQQAFIETQRGCCFRCKYCVYHKNLRTISYYSLERIFAELDHLIVKKKIRALRVFDAMFTSDIERAKKIIRYLLELKGREGVRLPWIYWELTLHRIDEEFISLIALLKYRQKINNSNDTKPLDRAQLYSDILRDYTVISDVGLQSFNNDSLKAVSRFRVTRERLHSFMELVNKYNIALKIDLILGLPLETLETYFEGLEFFLPYLENTDHILNIHILQILPGSDLEHCCEEYGIRYSIDAPHFVSSTLCLSDHEFNYASKISAVLFRIVNSPLRKCLFDAKGRSKKTFLEIIENVFEKIINTPRFANTKLVVEERVKDTYWNGAIFREIETGWLENYFGKIGSNRC